MSISTEDKQAWCKIGEELEIRFCERFGRRLGLSINPEKETNKYAPDLVLKSGKLADLKTQAEPFYKAHTHGLNPLQCVSFNRKDFERYEEKYPEIKIYFWVRFTGGTQYGVSVPRMEAVYSISLPEISMLWSDLLVPLHFYQKRLDDPVNAKSSLLLDTSMMKQEVP